MRKKVDKVDKVAKVAKVDKVNKVNLMFFGEQGEHRDFVEM